MGKPKGKSLPSANGGRAGDTFPEALYAPKPSSSLKAADGHNVDGWAEEDIRTYNELLHERARLETEKIELEQKSSRHQTQRALLDKSDTPVNNYFIGPSGGDQKFVGTYSCCLDGDLETTPEKASARKHACRHEICRRAKTVGVSWMEMDTIKYYQTRIKSEKSERMQNALRKQRDIELSRVKKEDDEHTSRERKCVLPDKGMANSNKGSHSGKADRLGSVKQATLDMLASQDALSDPKKNAILEAARENEHIVRRIRGRLDKIRHDVNSGKVSPAVARAKLDQANSEMADAEKKNNEFRKMILDVDPAFSQFHQSNHANPANPSSVLQTTMAFTNSDAFSQAMNVMKGFFGASDPRDVQTAIADLRAVLEFSGPMSPVLQKSLRALEQMLSKQNAGGFTIDVTTGDGKTRPCNNVVEVMMNLRSKMQASSTPSAAIDPALNLDEDTVKANLECIKVEDAAKKDMAKMIERMANDTPTNIQAALKKIKTKAILKSPIPPLSDLILDNAINELVFHRTVKCFVDEVAGIDNVTQVSGRITSLVISTAHNKPENYLVTLDMFKDSIKRIQKKNHPEALAQATAKVEESMTKFVAAHEAKRNKSAAADKPALSQVLGSKAMLDTGYLLTGRKLSLESWNAFLRFLDTPQVADRGKVRMHVVGYIYKHLEEGIWDVFHAIAHRHTLHKFRFEPWIAGKQFYHANMRLAASSGQDKLQDTVLRYQQIGACPAMTAIIIAQRLSYQIRADFESTKSNMMTLRNLFDHYDSGQNREWFHSFSFIIQSIADLFAVLVFQITVDDPMALSIIAADVVSIVSTFVLEIADPTQAETNLSVLEAFISSILIDDEDPDEIDKLKDTLSPFHHMCQDSRYRCSPQHVCKARIQALNAENSQPLPAPVPRFGKENQLLRLSTMEELHAMARTSSQDFPRGIKLSLLVDSDWDVALKLVPHLKCLDKRNTGRKCECAQKDQDHATRLVKLKAQLNRDFSELNSFLSLRKEPPKSLWARVEENEIKLHDLPMMFSDRPEKVLCDPAEFMAMVKEKLGAGGNTESYFERFARLAQVPVNVPSIQKIIAGDTSYARHMKRASQERSSISQDDRRLSTTSEASDAVSSPCLPTVASSSKMPPPLSRTADKSIHELLTMNDRELTIANQLIKLIDGMPGMGIPASNLLGVVEPHTLAGIRRPLDQFVVDHIQMAYLVAESQGYRALQTWLEHNVSEAGDLTKYRSCGGCVLSVAHNNIANWETQSDANGQEERSSQDEAVQTEDVAAPVSPADRVDRAAANLSRLVDDFAHMTALHPTGPRKRLPKRNR
ncbi:hypothetical protein PV05_11124 [Exophiala xenobiotica]|uniref:Uncharacterized protein n=1 Tax=Exophiala xenobiotica TaxID=348802 RepID=A0A0D2BBA0_9EURO|nr:uncharacterized protein PV05_11124 [Exophiala xenobiotica]KIW49446.1 hypothetical protein PV05_11124 [Exophiala xenobiotica]